MNGLKFAIRMAARELRAARRRMALLISTVAIGVAALVATNSFTDNLRDSVHQQARGILGADLAFSSRQPFSRRVEALIDTLARRGELARITSFAAMAYVPRTAGVRLVQVAAVSGKYPFYGNLGTEPPDAWDSLPAGRHVVVDPSLLTALDARLGDTLALGESRFVITGIVRAAAAEVGFRFALGPRIYIPAQYLQETGLLGFGARAQYEIFLKLPPRSAQQLAERYRPVLTPERVRVRTVADDQRNLNQVLSQLTGYLGLVALMALLLGGIGVASAAVVLVRQRWESIAVLRCLGATAGRAFTVYLLEACAMALAGSVLGAGLGVVLQWLLPQLVAGLLPVSVTPSISWRAIFLGIGLGTWVTLNFSMLPLLGVRRISPLEALRRSYHPEKPTRDAWWYLAALGLAATTLLLAVYQVGSWRQGASFAGGIALTLAVLWCAAWALTRVTRQRVLSGTWSYVWRQGLANLHRPANQTATLILAIGFAAFLLGTLYLVQHNLLNQLRSTGGSSRPNLILFDIQPDQVQALRQELVAAGLSPSEPTPIVPMRILSINGRSIASLLTSSAGARREEPAAWALRREYRSTYRDTIVASERLVEGRWSPEKSALPARISVEQELARELGVKVGDEIIWDVQGLSVPSRVTSLREVDWARFEPNFFVVFAPGTLEGAPQTLVLLTRIASPAERGRVQRRITERFSNVSSLDLSLLQESLERLVTRVALAVRFMALFSLAVGVLVLIGALATSRFQRIREGALLRALGATRRQVYGIVFAEYIWLGMLASAVAVVLALAASWALARFLFEHPFELPLVSLIIFVGGLTALTVMVGLANSREVVRHPPLEVLRDE